MSSSATAKNAKSQTGAAMSGESRRDVSASTTTKPNARNDSTKGRVWERKSARVTTPRGPRRDRLSQNTRIYGCRWSHCGDKFSRWDSLKRHFRDYHTRPRHWVCEIAGCSKSRWGCTKLSNLQGHMRMVHKRNVSEDHAKALHEEGLEDLDVFLKKAGMSRGGRTPGGEGQIVGDDTPAGSTSVTVTASPGDHNEQKSESESPGECGAAFSSTFRCHSAGCTALFTSHEEVAQHERGGHRDRTWYYCPVEGCARGRGRVGFPKLATRNEHILRHKESAAEQYKANMEQFFCPEVKCHRSQRQFASSSELRRHLSSNAHKRLDRPYKCVEEGCHSTFEVQIALAQHRFHVHGRGERDYLCPVPTCIKSQQGNGYKSSSTLRTHVRDRHPDHQPEPVLPKN